MVEIERVEVCWFQSLVVAARIRNSAVDYIELTN